MSPLCKRFLRDCSLLPSAASAINQFKIPNSQLIKGVAAQLRPFANHSVRVAVTTKYFAYMRNE